MGQTPNATDVAQSEIEAPDFDHAVDVGEITHKGGYHQPGRRGVDCGCRLTTPKGAYRYVTVGMPDGRTVYFYHQTPVVVRDGARYRLDSGGWLTRSTRNEINDHTPRGVSVSGPIRMKGPCRKQDGGPWVVVLPDGTERDFEDGMELQGVGR